MAIFQATLLGAPPEIIDLKVRDTFPGNTHDGFAQPGERIAVSLEVILDFVPTEAFVVCPSEFGGVESPSTRFAVRNGDTLANVLLEPVLIIKKDCPTDFHIPYNLIYRKDTTFDTLGFEIHTVGMLDSCFLDSKVNRPGRKVMIRALCSATEDATSGYGSVTAVIRRGPQDAGDSVALFDDGKHADGAPGDGHFANGWWTLSNAYDYDIDIVLKDTVMQHAHTRGDIVGFTTKWFGQSNPFIIVADPYDRGHHNEVLNEMETVLDSLDLSYDVWNIWYRGLPDSTELSQWGLRKSIIVWATKLGGTIKHSTKGKTRIRHFLEQGGRIFLATPYLGSYISNYGTKEDSLFLEQMLLTEFVSLLTADDSTRAFSLHNPFTEDLMDTFEVSLSLSDSGGFFSFIDVIHAIPPAIPIVNEWPMDGDTTVSKAIGLKIEQDNYRAIYLSFDLEDIEPFSLRKDFLSACLEWIATETADSFAVEPFAEEEIEFVKLSDPYPNPFLHESTIPFTLLSGGDVNLVICDLSGRTVKRLICSALNRGNYYAVWDGRDEKGEETAVGYYFVRLAIATSDPVSGEEAFIVVSKKLLKLRK